MIKTVNEAKIGNEFEFENDIFEITGFKSRYIVFGKIKNYGPGKPTTCKVSLKDIKLKTN